MEPENYPEPGGYFTFHDHMTEVFRRVLYIAGGALAIGILGFLFSRFLVWLLLTIVSVVSRSEMIHPSLGFTDRFLTAAVVCLIAVHTLLLSNLYQFVTPGLYEREIKTFLIPFLWANLAPVFAVVLLASYAAISGYLGFAQVDWPPLDQVAVVRALLVRFYLITALSSFLLALPGNTRNLTLPAYAAFCVLIWLTPDHVFDTLLVLTVGACTAVVVVDSVSLYVWNVPEVETIVNEQLTNVRPREDRWTV